MSRCLFNGGYRWCYVSVTLGLAVTPETKYDTYN